LGIFDSIKNAVSTVGIATAKVLNTLTIGAAGAVVPAVKVASETKIKANVSNPVLKGVLEFGANNPATTALLGVGSAIVGTGKAVLSAIPTSLKVAGAVASPFVVASAVKSPTTAIKAIGYITPESLVSYAGKATNIQSVSDVTDLIKSNPIISGAGILAGTYLGAKAIGSGYQSYLTYKSNIETSRNTDALKKFEILPIDIPDKLPTDNKVLYDIEKLKSKTAIDLAEEETKRLRMQLEAKEAKESVMLPSITTSPVVQPVTKKKAVKKKAVKKKAVKKKAVKKKAVKKKAVKKKAVKKKAVRNKKRTIKKSSKR